ncbi:MAG: ADP-ribosylglycohydrolase family protein, partial [Frankia sp.]|nr:ADP-ribosylglycohydrolase family protein [Frankia sp.]
PAHTDHPAQPPTPPPPQPRSSTTDDTTAVAVLGARETRDALVTAVKLADAATGGPRAEDVEAVGAGWIAEEALAIAVYCALACAGDVVAGLLAAVNHGGDSDSTGAITGNLLGAAYGAQSLPADWVAELEALQIVNRVADDLIETFVR